MKTAISLPDDIFEAAERTVAAMGLSRSALYATALAQFLDRHDPDQVTARLDAVYAGREASLDPALASLQSLSLPADEAW